MPGEGVHALRVVGGELRRRTLVGPPAGVRPTSDRVREALFERLGDLSGQAVLDLYAGTGALAIEALSRGARTAIFVDNATTSLQVVRKNLARLGLAERSRVIRSDASAAARRLGRANERFDLIFVDAPYESQEVGRVLAAIVGADLLARDGVVVLESPKRHSLAPVTGLDLVDARIYGDTVITRLVRGNAEAVVSREG